MLPPKAGGRLGRKQYDKQLNVRAQRVREDAMPTLFA